MSVLSNKERAGWAMEALKRFDEVCPCGLDEDGVKTASVDLMANIFHLLARAGHEPRASVERAMGHYRNELEEEPPCIVCGAPISQGNLGHDDGCMLDDGEEVEECQTCGEPLDPEHPQGEPHCIGQEHDAGAER